MLLTPYVRKHEVKRIQGEGVQRFVVELMCSSTYKELREINLALWLRHAFSLEAKTDLLLNNIAEPFNSWIKDARNKPIITMLKMIR